MILINDLTRWDAEELSEISTRILDVVKSGCFMRGPQVAELEVLLGEHLGGMSVACVASGTDALVLALITLGVGPDDYVATTANAGGYATGAILRVGATPVLIDVDETTAQMSPEYLVQTIASGRQLKAIVVTHLFGLMAEISELLAIANQHDILLIEDCAQSFGASSSGIPAGSWGHAATFSFYPTKNLAALGDGGAVAFKDRSHAELCHELAQYGWSERYVVARRSGINSRMDEIQAAILNVRLKRVETQNKRRRAIVARYLQSLGRSRRIISSDLDDYVAHLAVLITPHRDQDIQILKQSGIGTAIHYPIPDHHQPGWRSQFEGISLRNTEVLSKSVVSIPCYPGLQDSEVDYICEILRKL